MQLCNLSMTISEESSSRLIKLLSSLAKELLLGMDNIIIRDSLCASSFWSYLQSLEFFGMFHQGGSLILQKMSILLSFLFQGIPAAAKTSVSSWENLEYKLFFFPSTL